DAPAEAQPPKLPQLSLEPAFSNARTGAFTNRPVFLTTLPGASAWLAVVAQDGIILVASQAQRGREVRTFLDITGRVSRQGNEEGLLGLAFHPRYEETRHLYVHYSAATPRRSVISRFTARPDLVSADPTTEHVIMEVAQPFSNHNGGMIAFGPDGYLYIALGDGGSAGDPEGNGQNLRTLLGSILRIDVDRQEPGLRYAVPPDNPFVRDAPQPGSRGEIWAYGLRNPWRFSFDMTTGDLWAADVGQNAWEEVDLIKRGGNYGWNVMEGNHCYRPSIGCRTEGFMSPIAEYRHGEGCSITGGYVYRGAAIPALKGAYVYSDFCSGRVWALRYDGSRVTEQAVVAETGLSIASFGEDADGELYVLAFDGVGVYRVREGR
ncbi:MAG: PQQ-dependent sugar dehydrogenase, partial [SAR202 cluster bacterium]|nr:PQQ-dependent sugar dehydrogenase [SAR202 cluster bacterium]